MKILPALLLLACSGSYDRPACVTSCGLVYYGDFPSKVVPYSCEQLQKLEDLTMAEFDTRVTDLRFKPPTACQAISGYSLYGTPESSWVDKYGRHISGVTICTQRTVQIGDFADIYETALSHELAHVVQNCNAIQPPDTGLDGDHADWYRDHIYEAINAVKE